MAELRKWYFCLNAKGFDDSWPLVQVAMRSCVANTDLIPHCLYNGENSAHIDQLSALGAKVIRHQSSLETVLRDGYGTQYDSFSGHWLRIDIPQIEQEDDLVLYTDIDVMFRTHPTVPRAPRLLAAAPERYRWRWPHFNSGVLVMNVPALRPLQTQFAQAITQRMAQGWQPPGHDQVSYNAFFRWRHNRLPHALNWKPYWGANNAAQIIHFHGPKPVHIQRLKAGQGDTMLPVYAKLWQINPQAYEMFCAEADQFRDIPA